MHVARYHSVADIARASSRKHEDTNYMKDGDVAEVWSLIASMHFPKKETKEREPRYPKDDGRKFEDTAQYYKEGRNAQNAQLKLSIYIFLLLSPSQIQTFLSKIRPCPCHLHTINIPSSYCFPRRRKT
jgi:hypothetical protein